ncbi:MAG: CocE/NonD family hydrolase [Dehalococcoidia bacterium]|nr:CocE/NonD family hydrolase [Dehalococcoidia bacterium]
MEKTEGCDRRSHSVVVDSDVEMQVRDGTILRSDIYRPNETGKFPTLVQRTPYSKNGEVLVEQGHKLAERGYVVVQQDIRGRYRSEGEFMPALLTSKHMDSEDGYDAVEWAAVLPWSTGRVGTVGISYNAWTQWELAHKRPPHLVAMMPSAIAADLLDRELSGVLRLGRALWWTMNTLAPDFRNRLGDSPGPVTVDEADRLYVERDRYKWQWYLPLGDLPDYSLSGMGKHWRSWLKDHAVDNFKFMDRHKDVSVPALTTTGWYDQQIGAIKHFTGMRQNGMTEEARSWQRLIVGPWSHTLDFTSQVGEIDFGPEAARDFFQIADDWFRYWLKGEDSGITEWPQIELFVMGANRWRAENEWPLARTEYTDYYLRSDGLLNAQPPGDEPGDSYDYDPRDPVMTLFSPVCQQEPYNQRELDDRHDILIYQTPPLDQPVEVTGPVTVNLWATSSARDTDFVVKLMDVWPDGFVQELCHGIVRARYRDSFTSPSLIEPGKPYEYSIQVHPTSNLFKRGHRIRLDVSSSDFPNFDRNHNTGGDDYFESTLVIAHQTVHHDAMRPSRVTLPIVS